MLAAVAAGIMLNEITEGPENGAKIKNLLFCHCNYAYRSLTFLMLTHKMDPCR